MPVVVVFWMPSSFMRRMQPLVEQTKYWVDPLVGLKLHHKAGDRWRFTLQGDIGGFGVGSDFAWHLFPVVEAAVGKRAWVALATECWG
jgi:hypothetical protein